jgi:hypothetical protein
LLNRILPLSAEGSVAVTPHDAKRSRVVTVFDEDYCENGSVIYGIQRLLMQQAGSRLDYDICCFGSYLGPGFDTSGRIRLSERPRGLGKVLARVRRGIAAIAERFHIRESDRRWETNLETDEQRLLPYLFEADRTQAIIVFTTQPGLALRIAKLAHIYSTTAPPHLVVVTPQFEVAHVVERDFRWLGVRMLRDGELSVAQARSDSPGDEDGQDEARAKLTEAYSFLAPEEYPRRLTTRLARVSWADLIGPRRQYPARVRDIVLFVRPDWMSCGSGTTFQNLAEWFRDRDALLIDLSVWPYREDFDAPGRSARVAMEQRSIGSALFFSARLTTSLPHIALQLGVFLRWLPVTLARQKLFQYSLAAKPRLLRDAVGRAKVSLIYINHYFSYGYARALIGERPFFLDTHDIQTVNFMHHNLQNFISRRADRFAVSLRDEMEITCKATRMAFVSQDEIDLAAMYIDRARMDYVLPLPRIKPCGRRDRARSGQVLIVASDNAANVQSLEWFFSTVWPDVLKQSADGSQPRLRICGSVAALMAHWEQPSVEFMGVVDSLRGFYEESDLVLLPVVAGAGVAIKTLEAVLYERPVIATRHALRGLPREVTEVIGSEDDPGLFAAAILSSLRDAGQYETMAAGSRRAAEILKGFRFYDVLGDALDAVRISSAADLDTRQPQADVRMALS